MKVRWWLHFDTVQFSLVGWDRDDDPDFTGDPRMDVAAWMPATILRDFGTDETDGETISFLVEDLPEIRQRLEAEGYGLVEDKGRHWPGDDG